jgi:hypothetical protein
MNELLNVFFLVASVLIIFSFPFSNRYLISFFEIREKNIFEIFSLNAILTFSLLLLLSFFEINLKLLFYVFLMFSLINLFFITFNHFKNDLGLLVIFVMFIIIYFIKIANYPILEWDAFSHWIYKVKNFYSGYGYANFSSLPNHNQYPPLGSYLWAFIWKGSLINSEYTGRLIFVYIYFLSLFLTVSKINFNLIIKIIILFFLALITFNNYLFSGYQEPLIFSLSAICLFIFIQIKNYNKFNIFHIFLILCTNLIAWTKVEGIFLILFLYIFIFFNSNINRKSKIYTLLTLIFIIILKKFADIHIYDGNINAGFPSWFTFVSIEIFFNMSNFLERSLFLIINTFVTFLKYPIFILFLLFYSYSLLHERTSRFENLTIIFFLSTSIAINLIFLLDASDWKFKAQVGLDRIFYSTSSVYLFFIVKSLIIGFKKIEKKKT